MIVTEFTETKGFGGFQPPSFDDTYQENKYHSQYKSCSNSPTHKEPSFYQLLEPDVFNNTAKDQTAQTSSSVICSPSSLNVTIFQLTTLFWASRLLPSLWTFSLCMGTTLGFPDTLSLCPATNVSFRSLRWRRCLEKFMGLKCFALFCQKPLALASGNISVLTMWQWL